MIIKKAPIRVVQYGLGPIGQSCVRTLLEKESTGRIKVVGAIDIDPAKAGRTLGELTGEASDIAVSDDAERTLRDSTPDVVIHTTSSFLPRVRDQFLRCMRAGANVVSSTEELPYPFDRHPEMAEELDHVAQTNGVTLVGTGVNPGYAMDALALMATGVCTSVKRVQVVRRVDAGLRRLPLQKKVGAGLSRKAFEARKAQGGFGHIGLVESLRLVMAGLGWVVEDINESLEPVIAERSVETPFLTVQEGEVAGIHHAAQASMGGLEVVTLDLFMYVGADNAVDEVIVDGDPPIHLAIQGGIFGDTATVGALVNAIPLVISAEPGLKTPADLPIPRCFLP